MQFSKTPFHTTDVTAHFKDTKINQTASREQGKHWNWFFSIFSRQWTTKHEDEVGGGRAQTEWGGGVQAWRGKRGFIFLMEKTE